MGAQEGEALEEGRETVAPGQKTSDQGRGEGDGANGAFEARKQPVNLLAADASGFVVAFLAELD